MFHVDLGVDEVISSHPTIFNTNTGSLQNLQASLTFGENTTPKFFKPRSVPYSLKPAIEKDLERLEKAGNQACCLQ